MKVFISWSGEASRQIAQKLFDWLPLVLQSVQPYMSSESIEKGTRWATSIANELEGISVGIVVLTADNLSSPWIHFEAGALAKVVNDTKLAPLLCGLKPSDIGSPLSQFQVTIFSRDDFFRLIQSINQCAGSDALHDARLDKIYNMAWDDISNSVDPIINSITTSEKSRKKLGEIEIANILEEILILSRENMIRLGRQEATILNQLTEIMATIPRRPPDKYSYRIHTSMRRLIMTAGDFQAHAVTLKERGAIQDELYNSLLEMLRKIVDIARTTIEEIGEMENDIRHRSRERTVFVAHAEPPPPLREKPEES